DDCLQTAEALSHLERTTESFNDGHRGTSEATEIRHRRQRSADRTVKALFGRTRILSAVLLATSILIAGYLYGVGRLSPCRSETSRLQSHAALPVSHEPRVERGEVKAIDKMTVTPVPTDIVGGTVSRGQSSRGQRTDRPVVPSGRAGADGTAAVQSRDVRFEARDPRSGLAVP